jgi:hypothetical protein
MFIPDEIETEVVIDAVLSGETALVKLPNGRVVFGYRGPRSEGQAMPLAVGATRRARLFVADFTRAELLGEEG